MPLAYAVDIPLRLAVTNDDDPRAAHANLSDRFIVSLMLQGSLSND
jgi:hypothetical protein